LGSDTIINQSDFDGEVYLGKAENKGIKSTNPIELRGIVDFYFFAHIDLKNS
jgi:hypothetical protein